MGWWWWWWWLAGYFWLTHMLLRGIGPARPKGADDDKHEVTPQRSPGSVSLQNYSPHTQTGFDSGGSQGQTCHFPPGFAHVVTK